MFGEWVWNQHEESYDSSSTVDPTGTTSGYRRVIRGGDFDSDTGEVRVSKRFHADPMSTSSAMGFRLVRIVNESYAPSKIMRLENQISSNAELLSTHPTHPRIPPTAPV